MFTISQKINTISSRIHDKRPAGRSRKKWEDAASEDTNSLLKKKLEKGRKNGQVRRKAKMNGGQDQSWAVAPQEEEVHTQIEVQE